MDTKRVEWIDIAKGIGILLVIFGHTIYLRLCSPIYAFHMPLFFFLSGLVFSEKKYDTFSKLFVKKGKTLFKPYLTVFLISMGAVALMPQWEGLFTEQFWWDLYTSNTNTIRNSSLWYIPCLFGVYLLFYVFNKLFSPDKKWHIVIVAVLFYAATWQKEFYHLWDGCASLPDRLPLKWDTSISALAFFALGYYLKGNGILTEKRQMNTVALCAITIFSLLLAFANGWANLNSLDFGRLHIAYYPIAILCIAVVVMWSRKIDDGKRVWIKRALCFYGRHCLTIFLFQSLFIRLYLELFGTLQNTEMTLYGNNPIYHQIGCFSVVAFVLSPLTVLLFDYLKKKRISLL